MNVDRIVFWSAVVIAMPLLIATSGCAEKRPESPKVDIDAIAKSEADKAVQEFNKAADGLERKLNKAGAGLQVDKDKCQSREWVRIKGSYLYPEQYNFKCLDNGRMDDGEVRRTDQPGALYEAYSRSGGYGEFQTLNEAKAQIERVVKERGI